MCPVESIEQLIKPCSKPSRPPKHRLGFPRRVVGIGGFRQPLEHAGVSLAVPFYSSQSLPLSTTMGYESLTKATAGAFSRSQTTFLAVGAMRHASRNYFEAIARISQAGYRVGRLITMQPISFPEVISPSICRGLSILRYKGDCLWGCHTFGQSCINILYTVLESFNLP